MLMLRLRPTAPMSRCVRGTSWSSSGTLNGGGGGGGGGDDGDGGRGDAGELCCERARGESVMVDAEAAEEEHDEVVELEVEAEMEVNGEAVASGEIRDAPRETSAEGELTPQRAVVDAAADAPHHEADVKVSRSVSEDVGVCGGDGGGGEPPSNVT
jgi:hypothetical protein